MKALLATSFVLLGFCGTNALAGWWLERRPELRLPLGSDERQKLAQYRAHAADYDTVFVGTSRVLRGFDPRVFDQRMAELGQPTRSFNFGLVSMGFLEEVYLVDWILAQRPDRLRWLLVEPTERDAVMRLRGKDENRVNQFTMRSVYWHGLEETALGLSTTWRSARKLPKKLELTRVHLLHAAHRLCNLGVGENLLNLWLADGPRGDVLVEGFPSEAPRGAEWQETDEPEPHTNAVEEPARVDLEIMLDLAERTRAAGVRPVFVMPPTPQPPVLSRWLDANTQWSAPADLLHYSRRTFPEILRDKDLFFFDEGHMNLRGAEFFTRRLALDFAALLREELATR